MFGFFIFKYKLILVEILTLKMVFGFYVIHFIWALKLFMHVCLNCLI